MALCNDVLFLLLHFCAVNGTFGGIELPMN